VKNVRKFTFGNDILHEILAPVKGVTTGKVIFGATEYLDAQTIHARVLLEQCHERDLVTVRRQNQVALQQKTVEQVTRSFVGSNVVKSGIGRVRGVKQSVVATAMRE